MEYTLCWDRALSKSEWRILVRDPYIIFRKPNGFEQSVEINRNHPLSEGLVWGMVFERPDNIKEDLTKEPNWVI